MYPRIFWNLAFVTLLFWLPGCGKGVQNAEGTGSSETDEAIASMQRIDESGKRTQAMIDEMLDRKMTVDEIKKLKAELDSHSIEEIQERTDSLIDDMIAGRMSVDEIKDLRARSNSMSIEEIQKETGEILERILERQEQQKQLNGSNNLNQQR